MADPSPFLSPINEEIARLKWVEAFMRGRVELEQNMYADSTIAHRPGADFPERISGLQVLLEGAPVLPERKMLWHCALEKLLDGTRKELDIRMEELEGLKVQMQAVGTAMAKADLCSRDLNLEFEILASTESIDSARAATVTSHKDWCDIKTIDVSVQKGPSGLLPLSRDQKQKQENERQKRKNEKTMKVQIAFQKYHERDLTYRRTVYRRRKSREQFLDSIPHRIQEYGTKYWTAVCDLGTVMESFANYLRNISSTCNSSGSTLWASAKSIKPLVDANCHTEAIEFAHHQSPIRFSPIYYQNAGSISPPPSGQTILFGCPLELRTVRELKKIPLVLEYLLAFACDQDMDYGRSYQVEQGWRLLNEIQQGWTGVEKNDRALIFQLVGQGHLHLLIWAYFMSLPTPVLSDDDIVEVQSSSDESARLIWNTWSQDPVKAVVLHAMLSCLFDIPSHPVAFRWIISVALGQNKNTQKIRDLLFTLNLYPGTWRTALSNINVQ